MALCCLFFKPEIPEIGILNPGIGITPSKPGIPGSGSPNCDPYFRPTETLILSETEISPNPPICAELEYKKKPFFMKYHWVLIAASMPEAVLFSAQ